MPLGKVRPTPRVEKEVGKAHPTSDPRGVSTTASSVHSDGNQEGGNRPFLERYQHFFTLGSGAVTVVTLFLMWLTFRSQNHFGDRQLDLMSHQNDLSERLTSLEEATTAPQVLVSLDTAVFRTRNDSSFFRYSYEVANVGQTPALELTSSTNLRLSRDCRSSELFSRSGTWPNAGVFPGKSVKQIRELFVPWYRPIVATMEETAVYLHIGLSFVNTFGDHRLSHLVYFIKSRPVPHGTYVIVSQSQSSEYSRYRSVPRDEYFSLTDSSFLDSVFSRGPQ